MAYCIQISFRNLILFQLLFTTSLLYHHGSSHSTNQYYITPNLDTPCPAEPCLTLDQFQQEIQPNLTSNTTLILLPGDHNLTNFIEISDISHFAILGNSTTQSPTAINSRIVCTSPASITFESISELEISTIAIVSCGASSAYSALHVNSVQYFKLSNVTLHDSANVSFMVHDSNGLLRGCQFIGNLGVGMNATNSTVMFEECNTFLGNFDGGVASHDSTLNFSGSIRFANNTARMGGGISAKGSIINCCCNGNLSFMGNSAQFYGGGIHAHNTTLNCEGQISLKGNTARISGGGIFAHFSTLQYGGEIYFESNSAFEVGGGIHAENTSVSISGESGFIENTAEYGGGIGLFGATININGECTFIDNSADIGGGLYAEDGSAANFNGEGSFINNSAKFYGGGVALSVSNITISGEGNFIDNSAENGGGLFVQGGSAVNINGESSFEKNSAQSFGGGIAANFGSIVIISGESKFIDNRAENGGGLYAQNGSAVNINGESSFKNNSANLGVGGGIGSSGSTMNISGESKFIDNTADIAGGGIFAQGPGSSAGNISGESSFINNSAKLRGGGIGLFSVTININGESNFIGNSADIGGGLDVVNNSAVNINGESSFINNSAQSFGGGIVAMYGSTVNISGESNFISNTAESGGGGLYARDVGVVHINGKSSFINNIAHSTGGGIDATHDSTVSISGNSNFTENWSQYGGGVYMDQSKLTLSGTTSFVNNSASGYGGAIYALIGNIYFSGNGNLIKNAASVSGGAISLVGSSKCYFAFNSSFYFAHNEAAQFGGAIYVEDIIRYCTLKANVDGFINLNCSGLYTLSKGWCFVQDPYACLFENLELANFHMNFFQLDFKDNIAQVAGSVLYGGDIDHRLTNIHIRIPSLRKTANSGAVFDYVTTIEQSDNATSIISSSPTQVCQCSTSFNKPDCRIQASLYNMSIYPGQTFPIFLVAVGQRNGTVPAVIHGYFDSPGAEFGDFQDTQPSNITCTDLHYTIFSRSKTEGITLYAEGSCGDSGTSLHIRVTLLDCPTGFMLSNSISNKSKCVCNKRLQRYTQNCNIDDQTITRAGSDFWAGLDNEADELILHSHCPLDYCKTHTVTFPLNDSDSQCKYNRSGLLCGGCKPGRSLVLGSSRCLQCSNKYLLLLVAFFLAGIGLVILLFILKLTVAVGTINGLVFYANIIALNRPLFFPSGETNCLSIFIAWLNLDLGVQTCFFDGMDTYTRTWLQFVFPAYVWVLVGAIVLFSHYSTWFPRRLGSNPVSVLATLFLLSYTKLLRTIITAFSFTALEYSHDSTMVWLYDGNIRYVNGKHIPLFLTALLALVFLFIPYTLLLLLGQWIQAYSRKRVFSWISDYRVKSFLDTHQAPFKDKHRYWAGVGLVIRCCLFLVFAFNVLGDPSVNLLAISSSMFGLAIVIRFIGRIYKEWYLDILEASFFLNLGILASGTFYVRETGGNQAALTYTSVSIAFATFCTVVVYHAQRQIRDSDLWKNTIIPKLRRREPVPTENDSDGEQEDDHEAEPTVPPTTTFIDLRELLLEDSN